ncbi:hypothetical protein [Euzebya tangerina]|uniref:hypothetical protein n=1 Tax=Euzebya tangerina TaxID=591198 RepID=UPI0013C2C437|nr:hypothetical protein [Euzebya tangerina]
MVKSWDEIEADDRRSNAKWNAIMWSLSLVFWIGFYVFDSDAWKLILLVLNALSVVYWVIVYRKSSPDHGEGTS